MTLVLDAGALLAVERGDRSTVRALEIERRAGRMSVKILTSDPEDLAVLAGASGTHADLIAL